MFWVDLVVILILVLSFIGGIREGVVRSFFSLVTMLIALPLAGLAFPLLAGVMTALPDNWREFLAYYISFGVISAILSLIFLLPRKAVEAAFGAGGPLRLIGGLLAVFGAAIFMVVFYFVVTTYPLFDWLAEWVSGSGVLTWLAARLGFVQSLLPEVFRHAVATA